MKNLIKSFIIIGTVAMAALLSAGCSKDNSGPIDGWYQGSIKVNIPALGINDMTLPGQRFSISESKLSATIPIPTGSGTSTTSLPINIELTGLTKCDNAQLTGSSTDGTLNGYGFSMVNTGTTIEQLGSVLTFILRGDNTKCKLNNTSYHGFQGVIAELPYTTPALQLYVTGTVTISAVGQQTTPPSDFTISLNATKQ